MRLAVPCRRLLRLGIVTLVALAAHTGASAALFERQSLDLHAEARAAGAEGKKLAVFLRLPECPGCEEMERTVYQDRTIEAAFNRRFRTVRLDISLDAKLTDPNGALTTPGDFARRLHAVATPSIAFFSPAGKVLYRHTGTLDGNGFRQLSRYVLRADYERQPFVPPQQGSDKGLFADAPSPQLPHYPEFTLQATDGTPRRLADFRGQVVALAVGYTQCPDICPTTLASMKAAVESLPAGLRSKVQVLFATLDPDRDRLDILAEYAAAFRPRGGRPILGLRGDDEQTARLIRQLQLVAERQPSASMGYTLDHTAVVFLFDRSGRLVGLSPYDQPLDKLIHDLSNLANTAPRALAKS